MTTVLDLDALQAAAGLQIVLASNVRVGPSATVTSEATQGFSDVASVELVARVPRLRGHAGQQVTVTVQQSSNGSDWTTAHAFTFTDTGELSFTLDSPDDYLRVVCTPGGVLREAVVQSVIAVPKFVDSPGGDGSLPSPTSEGDVLTVVDGDWAGAAPSGGSQAGAERWTGPYPVSVEDYDGNIPGILIGELDVAVGDIILDAMFLPDVTFAGDFTTYAEVRVGQPDEDYESFPPGGFIGGIEANYATFGDFLQIVGWAGKPTSTDFIKIDPVIVTSLPISAWLAFDNEPDTGAGRVWIKTVTPAAP